MAKFINTRKAVSEIEELIKNAGEKLILISPYLKLSKNFKELLTYRNAVTSTGAKYRLPFSAPCSRV